MESGQSRRHRRAIEREARGYPGALRRLAPTVGYDEWVSQFEAAELLGVSLARIGFLIQGGRLDPVHDGRGRAGVRRVTVDREKSRRAGAGPVKRLRILLGDVGRSLARGV